MKSRFSAFTKFTSIFLAILMVLYTLPIVTMAEEYSSDGASIDLISDTAQRVDEQLSQPTETYTYSEIKQDEEAEVGRITGEIIEKREVNVKHFRTDNGLIIAASYPYPVHYEENGQWKDIDNTISQRESQSGTFETVSSDMTASFTNASSNRMMSYSDGETTVSMGIVSGNTNVSVNSIDAAATIFESDEISEIDSLDNTNDVDLVDINISNNSSDANIPFGSAISSASPVISSNSEVSILQNDDMLSDEEYNQKVMSLDKLSSTVTYEDVLPDTNIEYIINPTGIKENIIVNSIQSSYEYMFSLDTDKLVPVQESFDTINIYSANDDGSADADSLKYTVTAGYMIDAVGEESYDVALTLINNNGSYYAKVTADPNWINSSDRVFPVKIDPTVKASKAEIAYQDATIMSNRSVPRSSIKVGKDQSYGVYRALMQFELPKIKSDEQVISAQLAVQSIPDDKTYTTQNQNQTSHYLYIHRMTESWTDNTAVWSELNNKYDSSIVLACDKVVKLPVNNTYTNWRYFDVTGTVKDWYNELYPNYGFMMKLNSETFNYRVYTFSDESYAAGNQPTLTVTYLDANGLESQWSYHTVSNGASGSVSVNDFTGHATYVHPDVELNGSILPVSISHIHNQNEKNDLVYGDAMKFGKGWRLSAIESIQAVTDDAIKSNYPYKYIDGDGTEHYFNKKKSGESFYRLETDETIKLYYNAKSAPTAANPQYSIKDEKGNEKQFGQMIASNKDNCYLTKVIDSNNNQQIYTYNSSKQLTEVYTNANTTGDDNKFRKVTFTYDSSTKFLTKITDPAGRVTSFEYSSDLLATITYPDGKNTNFTYYKCTPSTDQQLSDTNNNALYTAKTIDASSLEFSYMDYAPYRVQNILEKGTNGKEGGYLEFSYRSGDTTVADRKGNSEVLMFDHMGRTVSVCDNEGNAVFGGYEDTNEQKNLLKYSSNMQSTIHNLVKDNNFLVPSDEASIQPYWCSEIVGADSSSSVDRVQGTYRVYGEFCYCINKKVNEAGLVRMYQDVNVTPGETYTFSAYLKTRHPTEDSTSLEDTNKDGGGALQIGYNTGNGTYNYVSSDYVRDTNDEFVRYYVTINVPENITSIRVALIIEQAYGKVYIDGAQLEKGAIANELNVIDNGGLEFASYTDSTLPLGWTRYASTTEANGAIVLQNILPNDDGRTGKTVKIKGNLTADRYLSQTFELAGEAGESFVLGAWGRGYAFANDENKSDGSLFAAAVRFKYSDGKYSDFKYAKFDSFSNRWQFSSCDIVAEKAFSHIEVRLVYKNNLNTVEFDDIQLFKNGFGESYKYYESGDFKGKIEIATGALGYNSKYEYYSTPSNLKGELKKITYYKDNTQIGYESYEYDANRNLISSTDQNGVTTHYTYDGMGNVIDTTVADNTTVADSTAKISTQTTYDQTGSFAVSSTDARGNSVHTTYDGDNLNITKGNITSITDARGNNIFYDYDPNTDALTSVTGSANINDTVATVRNSYTYADYRLSGITVADGTTSSFKYSFYYDAFGRTSSVSVGSQTLISHTYEDNNGNLVESVYGNGDKTAPTYDSLDRITEMRYKDNGESDYSTLYTWQYGANGSVGRTTNLINNTYERYDYDQGERVTAIVGGNIDENGNDDGETYRISYGYDNNNRLNKRTYMIDDSVNTTSYTYENTDNGSGTNTNTKSRLSKITLPDNSTIDYSYDSLDRSTSRTHTVGTKTATESYTFLKGANGNETNLISEMSLSGVTPISGGYTNEYKYYYDANGNITEIDRYVPGLETWVATGIYEYDAQNQLIVESNAEYYYYPSYAYKYTYSATGNILSKKKYWIDNRHPYPEERMIVDTINYTYDDSNWKDLLTAYNGIPITYDEIGNPIEYNGNTYEWTQGRRLKSITNSDNVIEYEYNANGIRTSKTVTDVATGQSTKTEYILEGDNIIYQTDGTNQLWFSYDPNGKPVAFTLKQGSNPAENFYYTRNAQGDITGFYDSTGNMLAAYSYDAWGNCEIEGYYTSYAELNPFRYRGYYYDNETGLYYLNSRYYNSEWGRFINSDGTLLSNYGIKMHNLYVYCSNNPINLIDPTGYCPCPWKAWCSCPPEIDIYSMFKSIVGLNPVVSYAVNYVNKNKIKKEVKSSYTQDEAKAAIESIFSEHGYYTCVTFNDKGVNILNSFVVTNKYDRQKIGMILANTEGFDREYDDAAAEWFVHNVAYTGATLAEAFLTSVNIDCPIVSSGLTSIKGMSIHADIDYDKDARPVVYISTTLFEILGWD